MSSGLFFFLGCISSVVLLAAMLAILSWRYRRQEKRFAEAMMVAEQWQETSNAKDLLSLSSAVSYGLLLRQAILERCENIEDDDERLAFVDDLVEIAEAYGDGLVKRSKSSRY